MNKLLKSFAKEITPPCLLRGMRSLAAALRPTPDTEGPHGEQPPEWYDTVYATRQGYRKHYTESTYYFMWTVIADRIVHGGVRAVLDIGCGPGQFASLLFDKGIGQYCGIDFSPKSIELAQRQCPSLEFMVADISESGILESQDYDCVVALEFLEHVEEDVAILKRIRKGAKFFGSVPNFACLSHVRHFSSDEEVRSRYGRQFSPFRVDSFVGDPKGHVFYVMEGIKI